jgi:hypothetical protein
MSTVRTRAEQLLINPDADTEIANVGLIVADMVDLAKQHRLSEQDQARKVDVLVGQLLDSQHTTVIALAMMAGMLAAAEEETR